MIISHITFRDCRGPFFSDNLSRNSCIIRDAKNFAPTLHEDRGGGGGSSFSICLNCRIPIGLASFVSGPFILDTSPKCIDQEGLQPNCGLRHRIALIWC